ncbi:MAG: hypothetical protein FJY10_12080, partial [Bacteroidetes bacterium]|nr:hypothetical protein [Bacteroidota bacterium]
MFRRILYLLVHPLLLSILIGTVIIILLPGIPKYKARLIRYERDIATTTWSYFDLDNDGESEKMEYENTPDIPSVVVHQGSRLIDQWILKGEFVHRDFFFYADYDSDGRFEIYLVTLSRDSLFLDAIDPYSKNTGFVFFRKFLDFYKASELGMDCEVHFCKATDITGDKYKELVFTITTGFSAYPRKFYAVDIVHDTVITSPESCVPLLNPVACDIDEDGFDEFMADYVSFKNCTDTLKYKYNDWNGWLMVFDHNLHFLFTPKIVGGLSSWVLVRPLAGSKTKYLLVALSNPKVNSPYQSLMLFSIKGRLLKQRKLDNVNETGVPVLMQADTSLKKIHLLFSNGLIEEVDTSLNAKEITRLDNVSDGTPFHDDIDGDGNREWIFAGSSRINYVICRNDFSGSLSITANYSIKGMTNYSVIKAKMKEPQLFIDANTDHYYFIYQKNPWNSMRFIIYLLIFITLYGVVFLITKVQKIRLQHRYETERKISELQLRALKNRIDPHFTLNLMNSIGNMYENHDKEVASYMLGKYGKLLRSIILGSDSIETSLESELDYVRHYLDLEKLRLENRFDYKISAESDVKLNLSIPRMLLINFIENAVKHGMRNRTLGGLIEITIRMIEKTVLIKIKDNGSGRQITKEGPATGTGKGLEITDNIVKLYNELKKTRISYRVSDEMDENG